MTNFQHFSLWAVVEWFESKSFNFCDKNTDSYIDLYSDHTMQKNVAIDKAMETTVAPKKSAIKLRLLTPKNQSSNSSQNRQDLNVYCDSVLTHSQIHQSGPSHVELQNSSTNKCRLQIAHRHSVTRRVLCCFKDRVRK